MAEQVSPRKRPLEHTSEEEEKDTPKKKKVAVTKVVSRVANGILYSIFLLLLQTRTQSRKKKPGFDEEIFSETSYVVQNGNI